MQKEREKEKKNEELFVFDDSHVSSIMYHPV